MTKASLIVAEALEQCAAIMNKASKDLRSLSPEEEGIHPQVQPNSLSMESSAVEIITQVAEACYVSVESVTKGGRGDTEVVKARYIIIYLLREMKQFSYPMIGRLIGRDHTSVIAGYQRLLEMINSDPRVVKVITDIAGPKWLPK